MSKLSATEKILVAAAAMPGPFRAEQLTVAAWRDDPVTFGLTEYQSQYPNHHKVYTVLCGKNRGLVGCGYLKRVKGFYEVTKPGREAAEKLLTGGGGRLLKNLRNKVPADLTREIERLVMAKAFWLWRAGQDVTFRMAMMFWNNNQEFVLSALDEAEAYCFDGFLRCSDGQEIAASTIAKLRECHLALLAKHGRRKEVANV